MEKLPTCTNWHSTTSYCGTLFHHWFFKEGWSVPPSISFPVPRSPLTSLRDDLYTWSWLIMPPWLPTLRIRGSSRNESLPVMSPPKPSNLSQLACRQITNPKLLYTLLPIPANSPSSHPLPRPCPHAHTADPHHLTPTHYLTNAISVHKTYLHKTRMKKLWCSLPQARVYRLPESPNFPNAPSLKLPNPNKNSHAPKLPRVITWL